MSKSKCSICLAECNEGINLSNGDIVHKECYKDVLRDRDKIYNKIYECNVKIESADSELKSLRRKLLRFIGGGVDRDENLLRIINVNKKNIIIFENFFSGIKKQLLRLYDYWLDNPPDMNERRKSLLEEINYCEECGENSYLQIHHKVPISKGGSHKRDNLKLLCEDCHQSKHKFKFYYYRLWRTTEFEVKYSKLRKAIDGNRTVTFEYRKYEGEKSKRTIKPEGFKPSGKFLCVYGHCFLRNDKRTFAIKRITKLIIN